MLRAKKQRRKAARDAELLLQDSSALYVVLYTWCSIRSAVLPGRKHERSEASSARGMREQLRGQRARRPTPR